MIERLELWSRLPPIRNAYWSAGIASLDTKEAEYLLRSNHLKPSLISREKRKQLLYPETKTPAPSRRSTPIAAPSTSKSFPGLTAKRFGSGGLKPGGAVNTASLDLDLDLVDAETESEGLEEALTMTRVLRIDLLLREEETGRKIEGWGRRTLFASIPAIDSILSSRWWTWGMWCRYCCEFWS